MFNWLRKIIREETLRSVPDDWVGFSRGFEGGMKIRGDAYNNLNQRAQVAESRYKEAAKQIYELERLVVTGRADGLKAAAHICAGIVRKARREELEEKAPGDRASDCRRWVLDLRYQLLESLSAETHNDD